MSRTFKTTEEVFHYQEGRPPVFIAGKGVEIDYDLAVRLGLVKEQTKARKASDVENKAVKPSATKSKD